MPGLKGKSPSTVLKKILFRIRLLSLFFFLFSHSSRAGVQATYFVAPEGSDSNPGTMSQPFATLEKARDKVRTLNKNMTGDIVICLFGGTYELPSSFTLSADDSGTNGYHIIYQAVEGETPVISGGVKITGWVLHDPVKNIYRAAADKTSDTRQLWVNGARAVRARSVDASGWTENGDGYDCPVEVPSWNNITNVEVVSHKEWKCHRGPIASIRGSHAVMAQPYWNDLHNQYDAPPVWIENAYELLDAEGEWYFDRSSGTLYYKPRKAGDMNKAEIIFPKLETLISGSGVSNVQFKGLTFSHSTWLTPNTPKGFPCAQADLTNRNEQMQGSIRFDHCSDLLFESNTFSHLGSAGLQLDLGCRNDRIFNNTFNDISGSAISIGSLLTSGKMNDAVKDNTVENNLIINTALEYQGCVGILVGFTEHTLITHNELRGLPYSGISSGWGWSNTTISGRNNEISYNLIDSVMTVLNDGGAIYTMSSQPGATIHDNYIKNQFHECGMLYPDEGSSNMRWYRNVVSNGVRWLHMWTPSIQNDTIENNYYDTPTQTTNGTNCIIRDNTYISDGNWPLEALDIMKKAGRFFVPVPVADLQLSPVSLFLNAGDTVTISAVIVPRNATNKNVTWSSANLGVASVSPGGFITAIAQGQAKIFAVSGDGNKSDSCLVSVSEKAETPHPNAPPMVNLKLFPNPATDHISLDGLFDLTDIYIYDLLGRIILITSNQEINISHLSPGIYILKTKANSEIFVSKFIKR